MEKEMKKAVEMLKLCVHTLEDYSGNENVYGPNDASMRILEIKAFIWDQETFASVREATEHVDTEGYAHDLHAYSPDGNDCVIVYDNMGRAPSGYKFKLVATTKVDGRWTLGVELDFDGSDGIDAMNAVDAYLRRKD